MGREIALVSEGMKSWEVIRIQICRQRRKVG
jgi:hypothetical protein